MGRKRRRDQGGGNSSEEGEQQPKKNENVVDDEKRCPECKQLFTQRCHMLKHYRKKHHNLLKDGTNKEHGIPPLKKRASKIKCPDELKKRFSEISEERGDQLVKEGYQFVVTLVKSSINNDLKHFTKNTPEREFCLTLSKNNAYHDIARAILDYALNQNMLTENSHDEAGGILPKGFQLFSHGGVCALGLDRRDNSLPHFLQGVHPVGPDSNIRLVAKAMNTTANIVVEYGDQTANKVREFTEASAAFEEEKGDAWIKKREATWACEQKATVKIKDKKTNNAAYATCCSAFDRDSKCREQFGNRDALFKYGLSLLAEQGFLCALSGIYLTGRLDKADSHGHFQMSLDAIEPTKGHVKGNLRWVCRFLNSTNRDKDKRDDATDGPRSYWIRDSFGTYFAIEVARIAKPTPFVIPPRHLN